LKGKPTTPKPFNWTGENIRRLRIRYCRQTQEEFAVTLGIARVTLSWWETGRSNPMNGHQVHSSEALRKLDSLARNHQFEEAPGETYPRIGHSSHRGRRMPHE
jgi:transcriptional regulator with XRE-family HTH domain